MNARGDPIEAAARAACVAGFGEWREPPYNPLHTDALNNIWRGVARAAIVAYLRARTGSKAMQGDDHFVERAWFKNLASELEGKP